MSKRHQRKLNWAKTPERNQPMRIGIDLGGTKTELIAIDNTGNELSRERIPTPAQSYDKILHSIKDIIEITEEKLSLTGTIGIGMPGAISPATGLIKNSNTVCLNGKRFSEDLEKIIKRPVRIANDANCFALSEAIDGAGKTASIVFGAILGTGCGGGVVINQQLIVGSNAISGEWGHNPLPWASASELASGPCYCGKTGCIELFLSGTGIERDHYQTWGEKKKSKDIFSLAKEGDAHCSQTINVYKDRLARSLASIINIIDPHVIVLGGGVSNVNDLYYDIPQLLNKYVFSDHISTQIVKNKYGDSSGVRGAAWLWPQT